MSRPSRTGAAAASGAQVAAGLGAHVAAAGCLPSLRGLALAVPIAVGTVLLLTYRLPGRPLLRLAGGQVAVHAALAVAAACSGHAAGHSDPHLVMTAAHVAALVLCRAVLDRVVTGVERAAAGVRVQLRRFARPITPARLSLPASVPSTTHRPHQPRHRLLLCVAPRRGPPAVPSPALPV